MQKRTSSKVKQKQLQTKYLEQQTKKMEDRLAQLKKQVEQQKLLKASTNYQSTVTRWKKNTRTDAPLKNYAKQVLQQQKKAFQKFGIDQKKVTGTKTFSQIKKKIQQQKEQHQQKNLTRIPLLMKTTEQPLPVETIQDNFFKAKMDVKNLIKEKTLQQFLEQNFLQQYLRIFEQNGITQLGDLRFITKDQLDQMNVVKGHQVKILKRIKEEFQKQLNPNNNSNMYKLPQYSQQKQQEKQKILVQNGYGDGDVEQYQNFKEQKRQEQRPEQFQYDRQSQKLSEQEEEYDEVVLITVPLSQISLQTGQDDLNMQNQASSACFNCYKTINLLNPFSVEDKYFCSYNCLKTYTIQFQKQCPQCHTKFLKTTGYYQQGMWFCSIGCCPNHQQIQEMFFQWSKNKKSQQ